MIPEQGTWNAMWQRDTLVINCMTDATGASATDRQPARLRHAQRWNAHARREFPYGVSVPGMVTGAPCSCHPRQPPITECTLV